MTAYLDRPQPLSRYAMGTAHLHLRSGQEVTIPMSRAEAEALRLKNAGEEGSDNLQWHEFDWIQFAPVELLRFESQPELGWPLTADERDRQSKNGYGQGIVHAIAELHREAGSPEPSYSPRAMWCMHHMLTEGLEAQKFAETARMLVGEKGAALVAAAYRVAARTTASPQQGGSRTEGGEADQDASAAPGETNAPGNHPSGGSTGGATGGTTDGAGGEVSADEPDIASATSGDGPVAND